MSEFMGVPINLISLMSNLTLEEQHELIELARENVERKELARLKAKYEQEQE